jgi:hypothetical protein
VSRVGEAIRTLTFFLCSVLLVIVSVAAGGSGDAAQFRADTFRGLSASSTSSTVALRDFFNAWMEDLEDLAFELHLNQIWKLILHQSLRSRSCCLGHCRQPFAWSSWLAYACACADDVDLTVSLVGHLHPVLPLRSTWPCFYPGLHAWSWDLCSNIRTDGRLRRVDGRLT